MSGLTQPEAVSSRGACSVRLEVFQGPLEILIHLIRTEAIDIADIPLLEVARQYDRYLDLMRHLDLEAAGENLVLVAAMVHMKSRRLLPPDPAQGGVDAGDFDLEPPQLPPDREGLKAAAEHLQEREAVMELVYPRSPGSVAEYSGEQAIEADLFSLVRAFQAILKRIGDDPTARVTRERVSLVERMNWLIETLQQERRIGLRALFDGTTDRITCILTFLALLEVIRLRLVRAYQSHRQEDILIVLMDEPGRAGAVREDPPDA
jgi:segregation and condensation protein A